MVGYGNDNIQIGIELIEMNRFQDDLKTVQNGIYSLSNSIKGIGTTNPLKNLSDGFDKARDSAHKFQKVWDEINKKVITPNNDMQKMWETVSGRNKPTKDMEKEWKKLIQPEMFFKPKMPEPTKTMQKEYERITPKIPTEVLDRESSGYRIAQNNALFKELTETMKINGKTFDMFGEISHKVLKGFQMDYLGIMFFGMQMQKTFQGLLDPMLKASGITDTYSDALESLMEPLEPIVEWIDGLISGLEDLPGPLKIIISGVTVLGFVLGTLLFTVGFMRLGLNSLHDAALKSGVGLWTYLLQPIGWALAPVKMLGNGIVGLGSNIIRSGGIIKIFGDYLVSTKQKILMFGTSLKNINLKQNMVSLKENISGFFQYGRALLFGTEGMEKMQVAQAKSRRGLASFKTGLAGIGVGIGGLLLAGFLASGMFDDLFSTITDTIEPIVDGISDFIDSLDNLGLVVLGVAMIIGGALLLAFSPILAVPLLILGLILVFQNLLPALEKVWIKLGEIFSAGWQWIKDNIFAPIGEWIDKNVTPIWEGLKNKISEVWEGIKTNISGGWNWIKDNIFTPIKTFISTHVTEVWEGLKTSITSVWDGIKNTITTVWEKIKSVWTTIKETLGSVIPNPFELISNGLNAIKDAFQKIYDIIAKGPIGQKVMEIFNSLKSAIGLAEGGIVTKPTFAMVGEAGPEAVIPLSKMNSIGGNNGTNIGNVNINVSVSGSGNINERQLADRIGDVVIQKFRNTITR